MASYADQEIPLKKKPMVKMTFRVDPDEKAEAQALGIDLLELFRIALKTAIRRMRGKQDGNGQ